MNNQEKGLEDSIEELKPESVDEHIDKYEQVLSRKNELANKITQNKLQLEKNSSKKLQIEYEIGSL